jgi:hypothetical protein
MACYSKVSRFLHMKDIKNISRIRKAVYGKIRRVKTLNIKLITGYIAVNLGNTRIF